MQVFRHKSEVKKDKNTVLTIGTFDGFHLGHQEIIRKVKEIAAGKGSRTFFVTFDPHPRHVISGNNELKLLTLLSEKIELLGSYGIENLFVINFTKDFSRLTSKDFFLDYIIGTIGLCDIVIGHDHHFGRDRSGDIKTVEELGSEHKFNVTAIDPFKVNEEVVSSTRIRKALAAGDLEKANNFLGRPYSIEGKVIKGDMRGRQLGYPTANLELPDDSKLLPALGIYAVEIIMGKEKFIGLMSIGVRPTFYDSGRVIPEVYIYDFNRDIYGKNLKVNFIKRIRDEQKFSSSDELIKQMNKDKTEGLRIFNRI